MPESSEGMHADDVLVMKSPFLILILHQVANIVGWRLFTWGGGRLITWSLFCGQSHCFEQKCETSEVLSQPPADIPIVSDRVRSLLLSYKFHDEIAQM